MKFLLDSNVLIWAIFDPDRLTPKAADMIADEQNIVLVSHVSFWELSIKIALGKLPIAGQSVRPLIAKANELGTNLLPLRLDHILRAATLPHHHRDPFDRILIAQALTEDVPLVTSDTQLAAYEAAVIWK